VLVSTLCSGMDSAYLKGLERYRGVLLALLNKHQHKAHTSAVFRSDFEETVFKMVKNMLPTLTVSSNEYLSGFEADIVVRWCKGDDAGRVLLNIECDGPSHDFPNKRRSTSLRDRVLAEAGIRVVRIGYRDNFKSKEWVSALLRSHLEAVKRSHGGV
jgi:very-short-patch-repair endonuclease